MVEITVCARCGRELPKSQLEREFGGICPHCLGGLLAREEKRSPGWSARALTQYDVDHAPLKKGDTFRSFEILEIVARGGMGFVFRARQTPLNRTVALKILAPELAASDAFRIRFDREAKILAALNHPNIVQVFDFGREGELLFLAMEHVEGMDLQTVFDEKGRLDRLRLLHIIRDVARGLRCIHDAGLVHRDIKPANILITEDGQAKIADFGIAIEAEETQRLTETGTFIGTPHYVSPEHVQGKRVDGRSDLYSLGVILYQGLAGHPPFSAPNPTALLLKHVQEAPPAMWKSVTDIPPMLGEIVRKLLAKNPAARPDSALALERELDRAIEKAGNWQAMEEPAGESPSLPKRKSTVRRNPAGTTGNPSFAARLVSGIIVGLLLLAVVGYFVLRGSGDAAAPAPTAIARHLPPSPEKSDPLLLPAETPDSLPLKGVVTPKPADSAPLSAPPIVERDPAPPQNPADLSPPERRRRLEYYVSIINLTGVAAAYADLKGMKDEAGQLRKNMTQTDEKVKALVTLMKQEGQNAFVDDTLRPTDQLTTFENQTLEKIGKEQSIALLGTFVARVKGGSRARVAVLRNGAVEEFMIRFDERPKDLLSIVQVVGLIPGQDVVAGAAEPVPATRPGEPEKRIVEPGGRIEAAPEPLVKPKEAPPVVKRAPAPEGPALKDAEKLIREIFKEDYAKKAPADKLALAKKLLKHGVESKDEGPECFLLLREARDLATQNGDAATALKAINELDLRFEIDDIDMKSGALASLGKAAKTLEEFATLARMYVSLTEAAMAEGDFDAAERAASAGSQHAKRAKDIPLVARLEAKARECADLKARLERLKKAKEVLAKNPEDPESNFTVGQYLCLVRGEWDSGLAYLAKGNDAGLKAAAAKDLAAPAQTAEQVALGDLWWDLAEKEAGALRENGRRRAAGWYAQALPQLAGLNRLRLEKRIKDYEDRSNPLPIKGTGTKSGPSWSPIFDGKTLDCMNEICKHAWKVVGGALEKDPKLNQAIQSRDKYEDGEFRIRFEHRNLTRLNFSVHQGLLGGDTVMLPEGMLKGMQGKTHEILFQVRGGDVKVWLDGESIALTGRSPALSGHLHLWGEGEALRILSMDFRPLN